MLLPFRRRSNSGLFCLTPQLFDMKCFYFLLFVILTITPAAKSHPLRAPGSFVDVPQYNGALLPFSDSLEYRIIPGTDQSYGYDIFLKGKLLIHQPSIPCIPGIKGFAKKEFAAKAAKLVIGKIRKGVMPPTITVEEMKRSGIVI